MRILLKVNDVLVFESEAKYYIRYDSGELVARILEIEVTEEDAKKAAVSEEAAAKMIQHYQNIAMFGEDYMNRGNSR